jgi:hypothetical protein
MNLRQILQQYGFLIYPLLVFGIPVLARVIKSLSEQAQKRRAEIERERRLLESLRTGQPIPEPAPVQVQAAPKRAGRESLEELAAKRRAELARQRTAAQTARTSRPQAPVGGTRVEQRGGRSVPQAQGRLQTPGRMGVPSEVSEAPGHLTMPGERTSSEPRQPQAPSRSQRPQPQQQQQAPVPPPARQQSGRGAQQPKPRQAGAGPAGKGSTPGRPADAFTLPKAAGSQIVDPFAIDRDPHSHAPRGVHRGTDTAVASASARPGLRRGTLVVTLPRSRQELKRAWLMTEIFGKPVAMREPDA